MEAERANSYANTLEKKQKGFDRVIDEWRMKCDSLAHELDAAQRDSRNLATDLFKMRAQNDEMHDQVINYKLCTPVYTKCEHTYSWTACVVRTRTWRRK